MKIYTNRYHDFTPSQGIPVRITYGSPRWRLPYTIAASAKTVTPGRWFMEGTDEEFTERYRAMLDSHGSPASERNLKRYRNSTEVKTSCFYASMT